MPSFAAQGVAAHYLEWQAGLEWEAGHRGRPVVLIHSGSNSASQWQEVAARLAARHHLLAPDLYNCGWTSEWPGPGPLTFDAEAELVQALIERFGGRAHIVGHSFGGGVALRIAARDRDAVDTLTLIEPPGYPMLSAAGRTDLYAGYAGVRDRFLAAAAEEDYEGAWRTFIDHYHGRVGAWEALSERAQRSLMARTPTQIGVYQAQDSNPTTLQEIARLGAETLLIRCEHAAAAECGVCDLIADAAPDTRSLVIAGAGHMSPVSHADEVAAAIDAHIGRAGDRPDTRPQAGERAER
ncbi:MAG: alpha/beta hydrolase [Alphaproteobacteria bacterium]|nr:alpha/beta hydrolase [Alphaproteobacteria bacterium]